MSIDEMKASREMDMLVAEKVIGPEAGMPPLPYSTEIAAAWPLVKPGWFVSPAKDGTVGVLSMKQTGEFIAARVGPRPPKLELITFADTAPLAICRAALKVKGVT